MAETTKHDATRPFHIAGEPQPRTAVAAALPNFPIRAPILRAIGSSGARSFSQSSTPEVAKITFVTSGQSR
jgi:hypothetical protein